MFYYAYVLQSKKNGMWYTGFTADLRKRLKEHNAGKSAYTKGRGPFELIYYEAYKDKQDARSRDEKSNSNQVKGEPISRKG